MSASCVQPCAGGRVSTNAGADENCSLLSEDKRVDGGAADQVADRARLLAVLALQCGEFVVRSPEAVDRVERSVEECGLMAGLAASQHSATELDHRCTCEYALRVCRTWQIGPVFELSEFEL